MIRYKKTVDSTTEPVTTAEAKSYLNVDHSDDDTLIASLSSAARRAAEEYMQRSIFTQTWVCTMDGFPGGAIELLRGPVASITTLKYYDNDNSQQTWDSSNYRVDNSGIITLIEPVVSWPSVFDRSDAIEITFVAGDSDSTAIPEDIELAIKMKIVDMYEVRGNVVIGSQVNYLSEDWKCLLDPYKIYYAFK